MGIGGQARHQHRPDARWSSWQSLLVGTFGGFALAAVYGGARMATHQATRTSQLPLGPFMLLGAVVVIALLRVGSYFARHILNPDGIWMAYVPSDENGLSVRAQVWVSETLAGATVLWVRSRCARSCRLWNEDVGIELSLYKSVQEGDSK